MVRILLDCFGGDKSPGAHIEGGLKALDELSDIELIFTGDEEKIKATLEGHKYNKDRISIVHAPQVIGCDEKPTDAIRLKRESSLMKAIKILREDDSVSALVSTGSTGSVVAASTLRIGRLPGVIRPTFCPIIPSMKGGIVGICDSGANVECTPEHLVQFAVMGSLYLEYAMGVKNPRVALLNVGTEAEKGDTLRRETYDMLKELPKINFVGNMEARDLLSGDYDLIVCDGFSGNVLVKSTEGACLQMLKKLKTDISSKFIYKLGAALMYRMFMQEKEFMNYQNYGGSVLLGTEKTVIKGHGSADAVSVCKCIEQAYKMTSSQLNEKMRAALEELPFSK